MQQPVKMMAFFCGTLFLLFLSPVDGESVMHSRAFKEGDVLSAHETVVEYDVHLELGYEEVYADDIQSQRSDNNFSGVSSFAQLFLSTGSPTRMKYVLTDCRAITTSYSQKTGAELTRESHELNLETKEILQQQINELASGKDFKLDEGLSSFLQPGANPQVIDMIKTYDGVIARPPKQSAPKIQPESLSNQDDITFFIGKFVTDPSFYMLLLHFIFVLCAVSFFVYRRMNNEAVRLELKERRTLMVDGKVLDEDSADSINFPRGVGNGSFSFNTQRHHSFANSSVNTIAHSALVTSTRVVGAGKGCGQEWLVRAIPFKMTWFSLLLPIGFVVLALATIVILYVVEIGHNDSLAEQQYSMSSCFLLIVLMAQLVLVGYWYTRSNLLRYLCIASPDPLESKYVLVESLEPTPGTAAAVRFASALANAADPKTTEERKITQVARRRNNMSNLNSGSRGGRGVVDTSTQATSRSNSSSNNYSHNTASIVRTQNAIRMSSHGQSQGVVHDNLECSRRTNEMLITRAELSDNTRPKLKAVRQFEPTRNSCDDSDLQIIKTDFLALNFRNVTVRETSFKQTNCEEIGVGFVHNDCPFIYNEESFVFEQHDFEQEAVFFAHARLQSGLTSGVAEQRRWFSGENSLVALPHFWAKVLLDVVTRPYVVIAIIAYFVVMPQWVLLWFVGLLFCALVVACVVLARMKRPTLTLDNLDGVEVVRDHTSRWLPAAALVPGDVVVLRRDMVLPCDVVLLSNGAVVQQETLTGNIAPCRKYHIPDIKPRRGQELELQSANRLWAGSRVTQVPPGTVAVVTSVGVRTQVGMMTNSVWKHQSGWCTPVRKTKYSNGLNVARRLAFEVNFQLVMIAVVSVLKVSLRGVYFIFDEFVNRSHRSDYSFGDKFSATITFMMRNLIFVELQWFCINVATILLPWFLSRCVFARRLRKDAKIDCTVYNSLPVAGHCDTCFLDKTGTLTQRKMELSAIYCVDGRPSTATSGKNEFSSQAIAFENGKPTEHMPQLLTIALACCHKVTRAPDGQVQGSSVDVSMFEASGWRITNQEFRGNWCAVPPEGSDCEPVELMYFVGFEASHDYTAVIVQHGKDLLLFVKGSIDALLPLMAPNSFSHSQAKRFEHSVLSNTINDKYENNNNNDGTVPSETKYGFAVAFRVLSADTDVKDMHRSELVTNLTMLGYLAFSNELRENSVETVNELKNSGIKTFLASGDHVDSCVQVATKCGMFNKKVPTIVGEVSTISLNSSVRPQMSFDSSHRVGANLSRGDTFGTVPRSSRSIGSRSSGCSSGNEDQLGVERAQTNSLSHDNFGAPHLVQWRNFETGQIVYENDILSGVEGSYNVILTGAAVCRLLQRVIASQRQDDTSINSDRYLFERLLPNLKAGARLAPADKQILVQVFKDAGHVVGFVGDGWNDGPAMNCADIGLALDFERTKLTTARTTETKTEDGETTTESAIIGGLKTTSSVPPTDFVAKNRDLSAFTDVLKHGRSALSAANSVLLFGFVSLFLSSFGPMLLEGVRSAYLSFELQRGDAFRVVLVLIMAVAMVIYPTVKKLNAINSTKNLLTEWAICWAVFQLLVAFGALVACRYAIVGDEFSVNSTDLEWVGRYGSRDLYNSRLTTTEQAMTSLFLVWFLCTAIFSAALSWHDPFRLFAWKSAFLYVGVLVKALVMVLLWSGPGAFTCWVGVNCDNHSSFDWTGDCQKCGQLPTENRRMYEERAKFMNNLPDNASQTDKLKAPALYTDPQPTQARRCNWDLTSNGGPSGGASVLKVTNAFFGNDECVGSHNCINTAMRWQFSLLLVLTTLVAAGGSLALGWHFRRQRKAATTKL
eukprot:gene678-415_t